jgi:hypothetical protein
MRVTIDRHSLILPVSRSCTSVSASAARESSEGIIFAKAVNCKKQQRTFQ